MANQTRTVIHHAHEHRRHPLTLTREYLARTMMKVEMPQGADMVDLKAAHLPAFQTIPCGQCPGSGTFGLRLSEHALRLHVAPDGGIGRNRATAIPKGGAQIIHVKLHRPARVFAILRGEGGDQQRRQTGKAADIAAQAIFQDGHRVVGTTCSVIPAFQCRDAKGEIQSGDGMTPHSGSQQAQGGVQGTRRRRCGQQGPNNRKAQPGAAVTQGKKGGCGQKELLKMRCR